MLKRKYMSLYKLCMIVTVLCCVPVYCADSNSLAASASCVNDVNSAENTIISPLTGVSSLFEIKDVCDVKMSLSPLPSDFSMLMMSASANDVNNLTQGKLYSTIQSAIDEANDYDVVEAACRIYRENIDFLGKNFTLRSRDPNDWTKVGRAIIAANDVNQSVVTFGSGEDANAVLWGFTITGGLRGIDCNGTSPTVINCIITDNGNDLVVGGGVCDVNGAAPLVANCFIVDNDANSGAGVYNLDSSATFRNCVISRNSANSFGGGICDVNSSPLLVGCTITDNQAGSGGGIFNDGLSSQPQVTNTIVWGNDANGSGDQVYNSSGAEPEYLYCDIEDCNGSGANWDGTLGSDEGGNIDGLPGFDNSEPEFICNDYLVDAVNRWKFDANDGNTAYDCIDGNDGIISGADWTQGLFQSALDYNGVDDYVSLGSGVLPTGPKTLLAWVKIPPVGQSVGTNYDYIIYHGTQTDSTYFYFNDGVGLRWYDRSVFYKIEYTVAMDNDQWHLVGIAFDGNDYSLWFDGCRVAVKPGNDTNIITANEGIGGWPGDTLDRAWLGEIDEVRVYSRALADSEIRDIYNSGNVEAYGHWTFDEITGGTAYDSQGDNDGTVYGVQWSPGKVNGALEFDGSDDYVRLTDHSTPWLPFGDFAVAMWVKFDRSHDDPANHSDMLFNGDVGWSSHSTRRCGFSLRRNWACDGAASFYLVIDNNRYVLYGNTVLEPGLWYYVAAVRRGNLQQLFVNGVEDSNQMCGNGVVDYDGTYSQDRVSIGTRLYSSGLAKYCLDGLADDVRLYDRSLDAAEINELYLYGLTEHYSYRLDFNSPCINTAKPNSGVGEQTDIDNTSRTQRGRRDIGADEVPGVLNRNKGLFYDSIQAGIYDANDGDTVEVMWGHYYEQIDFDGKAITLTGSDPNDDETISATIIDANNTAPAYEAVTFRLGEDYNSVLTGLTMTGGWRGVYCDYEDPPSPTITKCDITGNAFVGLWTGSGAAKVSHCRVFDNDYGGINCAGAAVFENCIVADNSWDGFRINSVDETKIRNCTIINNDRYGVNGDCNELTNCIIWDNVMDLYHCQATYSCIKEIEQGVGNFSTDPLFVDEANGDYRLDIRSWCIDAGDPCSDYSNEPDGGGGRVNVGVYGNTAQAAVRTDADNDGLPDQWELAYWPGDDPNEHDPNDNPDGDSYTNWVEYLFGYDPNIPTAENMEVMCPITAKQIDPTESEIFTFSYYVNADANVVISFVNTNNSSDVARTLNQAVITGQQNQVNWNGKDVLGRYAVKYFYDVRIDADDGDGNNVTWYSPDGCSKYIIAQLGTVDAANFNPYKNIPVEITRKIDLWGKGSVRIVATDDVSDVIYDGDYEHFIGPWTQSYYWYGHCGVGASDPNYGKINTKEYNIFFGDAGPVNKGAVLVYYDDLLSNMRCNPYQVVPTYDEVTTISYDLSADASVTIDITDPDGNYFATLLDNTPHQAGHHEVVWYGTDGDPNDPNSVKTFTEGVYLIEIYVEGSDEKIMGSITAYR